MNLKLYLYSSFFLLIACGNSIPFENNVRLLRPVGIQVIPQSDLKFKLIYFVQNQESTFDGYNLYISRNPISEGNIGHTVPALSINGALPTFQHGPEDFDVDEPKEALIQFFNDGISRFEDGITYYFRLTAHSRRGSLSKLSNEVSAKAIE